MINLTMNNRYFGIAAALVILAVTVEARALSTPGLSDQLRACAAETDGARRLACYDQVSASLPTADRAAAPIASANVASAPTPAPAPAAASSDFGVDNGPLQAKASKSKPQLMTALVARVSNRPQGELVVTLDNGQTWVQNQVSYFPVKPGDKVEINVGAIGSYVMWAPSSRRASKVTRVD